ncbi:MAG: RNA-directed DNA polymerase, partial [Planctomycetia bacterium]|nr:RNA-directed DNA polymerase [Planctomycetia bacterium]
MSLFNWLFRRGRKTDPEPVGPPPVAPVPVPPPGSASSPPTPPGDSPPASDDPYAATEFLPITRQEILDAAEGKNLMATAFQFGRQSIIPPASDPRTLLIDRALVTHGLLSPEELAEIHRVGEEYDKVKPTDQNIAAAAGLAGSAAVQAYRESKEREKARKKAESAARKKQRAEEVKHRRATDIIFLGRGVSGRLHLRLSDEVQLSALGLPVMHSPADVASVLGVPIKQLRWLAFHSEAATHTHYVKFQVPKKSGGMR